MPAPTCRHFSGSKPCAKSTLCEEICPFFEVSSIRLLIVHLGALGSVVRSTSLLKAIKRKYPSSQITWVTDAPAHRLLQNHPLIDRVFTTQAQDLLALRALEFEVGFVIDKSLMAAGVLKQTQVDQIFGFIADSRTGAILPATPAAEELWTLGLDNHKKFFVNTKPETQLLVEALELGPFRRDEYNLPLSLAEEKQRDLRKSNWSMAKSQFLLGINTGCSDVIPAKKLSVEFQRQVIRQLSSRSDLQIVLLGGPEDEERNRQIAQDLNVIESPTTLGLRDGLVSVAACDFILTGDSLGMHMAISQKKYTIAWFGPTCAQEIDLYGRGEKIQTWATCAPCWKRVCSQSQMCYDQVSESQVLAAVDKGIDFVSQFDRTDSLFGRSAFEHSAI